METRTLQRVCPACRIGRVNVKEIPQGAQCNQCHESIEVDFFFHVATIAGLLVLQFLAISFDKGKLVIACFAGILVYTIFYETISARFFPLKASHR